MTAPPPCETIMVDSINNPGAVYTDKPETLGGGIGVTGNSDENITAVYNLISSEDTEIKSMKLTVGNARKVTVEILKNEAVVATKVSHMLLHSHLKLLYI